MSSILLALPFILQIIALQGFAIWFVGRSESVTIDFHRGETGSDAKKIPPKRDFSWSVVEQIATKPYLEEMGLRYLPASHL